MILLIWSLSVNFNISKYYSLWLRQHHKDKQNIFNVRRVMMLSLIKFVPYNLPHWLISLICVNNLFACFSMTFFHHSSIELFLGKKFCPWHSIRDSYLCLDYFDFRDDQVIFLKTDYQVLSKGSWCIIGT